LDPVQSVIELKAAAVPPVALEGAGMVLREEKNVQKSNQSSVG
jgi:hypothetical protein